MNKHTHEMLARLAALGITQDDAYAIRRIAMTLHRWHELECGDSNNYASWCIVRGHKANGEFAYDDNGKPYLERHVHSENKARYEAIPDREQGAIKRLRKIVGKYALNYYVQTDPRGAPLYILPAQYPLEQYNSGVAVHK